MGITKNVLRAAQVDVLTGASDVVGAVTDAVEAFGKRPDARFTPDSNRIVDKALAAVCSAAGMEYNEYTVESLNDKSRSQQVNLLDAAIASA